MSTARGPIAREQVHRRPPRSSVNTISRKTHKITLVVTCSLFLAPTVFDATPVATAAGVADGTTAILTPQGTWIVPPPGAPLLIAAAIDEATIAVDSTASTAADISGAPAEPSLTVTTLSCTNYRAGWYATDNWNLWGGHAGIRPQNLPVNTAYYCPGKGMGYTAGVTFGGAYGWIQAGVVTFPGELTAKWMCQANDQGAFTTKYGPANAYGNGATVYTWFARDSSGVWRTYRYDTGPYSVELGCTISRGDTAGEPLQVFGEIQGATSTSAPMGPWEMFDLRYLGTDNQWRVPTQLQAHYRSGTPCPPYGAGVVSGGSFTAGSGQACSTGTTSYP